MATALISSASPHAISPTKTTTDPRNRDLSSVLALPKKLFTPHSTNTLLASNRTRGARTFRPTQSAYASWSYIPKQFTEENLKDGLMENYKNVPQCLYGLTPSQMDMFMTEDSPIARQKVSEESISSARNYLDNGGMWSMSGMNKNDASRYSMKVSMYRGGARGSGRPRSAPPDLPSLLLDARIVYLGMPIFPAVTELLVAQLMWLDYDNPSKPIYLYINSPGTQNEKMETVGSETEAYAIADTMAYCKSKVYTVNCGMAFGQAAMLLSLGAKGYRALQPNASTKLYLPKVSRSSGSVIDMWIKAKELDANTKYYIELLAKGIGKPEGEIEKEIQRPKYFNSQEAIAYGIADKIIDSRDVAFDKRNYDEMLAQSKAMRSRAAGTGPQAATPSGFR